MVVVLRILGAVFIVLGIVGGLVVLNQVDWQEYEIARKVYDDLRFNEFAEAAYYQQRGMVITGVSLAIGAAASGIITGVIFLAAAYGLDLLEDIKHQLRPLGQIADQVAASREQST